MFIAEKQGGQNTKTSTKIRLETTFKEKRPFLASRVHISLQHCSTQRKTVLLGWDQLVHSPYSPGFVVSGFNLFRPLDNLFKGKEEFGFFFFNFDEEEKKTSVGFQSLHSLRFFLINHSRTDGRMLSVTLLSMM